VPVQIYLYPGIAELLHKQYAEWVASTRNGSGSEAALANGETLSEPPAAMDLQSGEESLQK
jgi:hypothetical protein